MSIMCFVLLLAQVFVVSCPCTSYKGRMKWGMKALNCGIVTVMTDGCFQRISYTFYPFQFFYYADIICKVLCKVRGLQASFQEQTVNILGFVGHTLSGEPTQLCLCSSTLVLDNKWVYIAVFQRGEGRASPSRNEKGERMSSHSDGS